MGTRPAHEPRVLHISARVRDDHNIFSGERARQPQFFSGARANLYIFFDPHKRVPNIFSGALTPIFFLTATFEYEVLPGALHV
jgi:hypothetical protein